MANFFGVRKIYSKLSVFELVLLLFAFSLAAYFALVFLLGSTNFFATVVSNSMAPTLWRGDLAVLSKIGDYKIGDIIVFKRGKETIIHRIAKVLPEGFKTKGDNNSQADFPIVGEKNVFGKVVFVLPKFGHINLYLSGR